MLPDPSCGLAESERGRRAPCRGSAGASSRIKYSSEKSIPSQCNLCLNLARLAAPRKDGVIRGTGGGPKASRGECLIQGAGHPYGSV